MEQTEHADRGRAKRISALASAVEIISKAAEHECDRLAAFLERTTGCHLEPAVKLPEVEETVHLDAISAWNRRTLEALNFLRRIIDELENLG